MKIWTITTDTDEGTNTDLAFSEKDANSTALSFCSRNWTKWTGRAIEDMPTDWVDAQSELLGCMGYLDTITVSETDISAHPLLTKIRELLFQLQKSSIELPDDIQSGITSCCTELLDSSNALNLN